MDFLNTDWDEIAYLQYKNDLCAQTDEQYRQFQRKLILTSKEPILGVRLPILQRIARQIAKGDADGFLRLCRADSFEEVMVEGLVLAHMRLPFAEKAERIGAFLPKINNWSVCDSFCAALKIKPSEKEAAYLLCRKYFSSPAEYERRFAVVFAMDALLCDAYIDNLLSDFSAVPREEYYVSMAVAWAVSVCFVHHRDKTLHFLQSDGIADADTYIRALQKITDSCRVSTEDKQMIRQMRAKLKGTAWEKPLPRPSIIL